jgi:hypothetical protein
MNEIIITIIPENPEALEKMPTNLIRKFPSSMRIAEIDKLIREYFQEEMFIENGEVYNIQAKVPASHPDAFVF